MINKLLDFLKKTFSAQGNYPSFSRVGTGVIVVVVLSNITYIVIHTGKFPDPATIIALCAFNTSLYITAKKFDADTAIADINKLKPVVPDTNTTTANVIVQPTQQTPQGTS